MMTISRAWGKCSSDKADTHHLVHHCADVAAVFISLLAQPLFRARAEAALGRRLEDGEAQCLAVLAFLHDIGKLAPGFQAKGWTDPGDLRPRGHLECGLLWTNTLDAGSLAGAAVYLARWPGIRDWLHAAFSHHGRPVDGAKTGATAGAFFKMSGYDWKAEETLLGRALLEWLPGIATAAPPPAAALPLVHFFCGLLTLADCSAWENALVMKQPTRVGQCNVSEERADGSETRIAGARCVAARLFHMGQEVGDEIGLEIFDRQLRGRLSTP